jgi:TatD DNase family protein
MTMTIVDSHAHLDMDEFDPDREAVLERAFESGISSILCPIEVSSPKSADVILGLAARHDRIFASAGLHPHQASGPGLPSLARIEKLAAGKKIRAVGEIGLDFHYSYSSPDDQGRAFREQLDLAERLGLPAIIHSRNAGAEIARIVRDTGFKRGGILHCFTERGDLAREMMAFGFYISFSGILTFPNAGPLREVARTIPIDRILVETDAPYLAPVPFRGKRNEPAYVIETAKVVADLKNLSLEDFSEAIRRNFDAFLALGRAPSAAV